MRRNKKVKIYVTISSYRFFCPFSCFASCTISSNLQHEVFEKQRIISDTTFPNQHELDTVYFTFESFSLFMRVVQVIRYRIWRDPESFHVQHFGITLVRKTVFCTIQ